MTFSGWLVASGKADSVSDEFFVVGHTHSTNDQRFGTIASALSKSSVLETPSDFLSVITARLPATQNRDLIVETLNGTWDFNAYLSLNVHISGIVPCVGQPYTNHVWRVVRWGDLASYGCLSGDAVPVTVAEECVAPGSKCAGHRLG